MQTIGIIGCGGFIGSHLLERFIGYGNYRILGIDRSTAKIGHLLHHPNVTVTAADVHSFGGLAGWIAECDCVMTT